MSLTGTNPFAGDIDVLQNGTLSVDGNWSGAAGLITVDFDATLGGGGSFGGDVALNGGARFEFVAGLTLTVGGEVTLDGFGVDNILDANGSDYSIWSATVAPATYTIIAGNVNFAGINPDHTDPNNPVNIGNGKSAYLKDGSLQLVVIPEPGSLGLLGLVAVAGLMRRRLRR